jgi:PPOX class probable F420-dependent enzyme
MSTAPPTLEGLRDQRTVLLTSFKRDGTPVGTPVHIAFEGSKAYLRTYDKAWKFKRIRRNPEISLAPSTVRGVPTGPAIQATARILDGEEATPAARALARKYPILHGKLIPMAHRMRGYKTVHMRVEPRQTCPPGTRHCRMLQSVLFTPCILPGLLACVRS